jgi:hypothetical protein
MSNESLAGRAREFVTADDIDRRIVALDEAFFLGLGVVFAPVPCIGAIDGLDSLSAPTVAQCSAKGLGSGLATMRHGRSLATPLLMPIFVGFSRGLTPWDDGR